MFFLLVEQPRHYAKKDPQAQPVATAEHGKSLAFHTFKSEGGGASEEFRVVEGMRHVDKPRKKLLGLQRRLPVSAHLALHRVWGHRLQTFFFIVLLRTSHVGLQLFWRDFPPGLYPKACRFSDSGEEHHEARAGYLACEHPGGE